MTPLNHQSPYQTNSASPQNIPSRSQDPRTAKMAMILIHQGGKHSSRNRPPMYPRTIHTAPHKPYPRTCPYKSPRSTRIVTGIEGTETPRAVLSVKMAWVVPTSCEAAKNPSPNECPMNTLTCDLVQIKSSCMLCVLNSKPNSRCKESSLARFSSPLYYGLAYRG